jgi:ABC-type multidrug transport system fused ATPase/permease subunit
MALFRIMEASSGSIEIDGVDISTIGLQTLRESISIIPQGILLPKLDPVLFNGTVRHNLDPFDRVDDNAIWSALESVNLKTYISSLPSGLLNVVHQNGENFSVGQRQLICLARALIRNSRILVLDEATAAIDVETDSIIQKTIRSDLKLCTVLTIAHRINTLYDYDKILVLDQGSIVEFDTPAVLLEKRGSFYKLAKESGLTS